MMKLGVLVSRVFRTNIYIVYDEVTLQALIVDPGEMVNEIRQFLAERGLKPVGILLTHSYYDHVRAARELQRKCGCPAYIHADDAAGLKPKLWWGLRFLNGRIKPLKLLSEGEMLSAGGVKLRVIHTPGHTPGSICFEVIGEKIVLTGDTVFANGIGRTDVKGGDELAMIRSLLEKVNKWEDDVMIFPGHGESALMREVRMFNGVFREVLRLVRR